MASGVINIKHDKSGTSVETDNVKSQWGFGSSVLDGLGKVYPDSLNTVGVSIGAEYGYRAVAGYWSII